MLKKTVQLRLNTQATGTHDRWRLNVDGKERNVAGVKFLKVPVETAAIVIETGEMKWCIQAKAIGVDFTDAPVPMAIVY